LSLEKEKSEFDRKSLEFEKLIEKKDQQIKEKEEIELMQLDKEISLKERIDELE
jgi:hypothetical protein